MEEESSFNHGVQPIDGLLAELGLDNHALVNASHEHLTHKQVAKARKGRRLTRHMQEKVLRALNAASGRTFGMAEAFNYHGSHVTR